MKVNKFINPFSQLVESARGAVAANAAISAAVGAHAQSSEAAEFIDFDRARFTAGGSIEIPVTFFRAGAFRTEDRAVIRLVFDRSFTTLQFAEFFVLKLKESRMVFDEFFHEESFGFARSA